MAVLLGFQGSLLKLAPRSEIPMHDSEPSNADDELGKIVRLTDQDVRDATRLFRLLSHPAGGLPPETKLLRASDGQPTREDLVARARIILNSRRLRWRYFSPAIFGEPAWDVLLVLYVTEVSDARLTIGKLADWIKTPHTTALRWVGYLEKERLVERQPHPTDRRVIFIRLLEKGRVALEAYLRAVPDPATA